MIPEYNETWSDELNPQIKEYIYKGVSWKPSCGLNVLSLMHMVLVVLFVQIGCALFIGHQGEAQVCTIYTNDTSCCLLEALACLECSQAVQALEVPKRAKETLIQTMSVCVFPSNMKEELVPSRCMKRQAWTCWQQKQENEPAAWENDHVCVTSHCPVDAPADPPNT